MFFGFGGCAITWFYIANETCSLALTNFHDILLVVPDHQILDDWSSAVF
jgi:hypothetical protein